jgi:putative photosynthetic complex assembly protein
VNDSSNTVIASAGQVTPIFPPAFLAAVAVLALGSLVVVAVATQAASTASANKQAETLNVNTGPVVLRQLRFVDLPDGSVQVVDTQSQQVLDTLVGEEGFVRSVVRGLANARKQQGIGPAPAFTLVRRADGGINFEDPATGRKVSLEAFGSSNAAAFKRLLVSGPVDQKTVQ